MDTGNKSGRKKWRLLFWVNCVAAITLYIIFHISPVKYFLIAPREVLIQWYPHLGFALFYLLKIVFVLQAGLGIVAVAGLLYIFIATIQPGLKNLAKRLNGRSLQFKIISLAIMVLLLAKLLMLAVDFYKAPGNKDYALNDAINTRNRQYAKTNPLGFTDIVHSVARPKGVLRIGVLGDSFVWGDGVPYEQAWSHKLERKLHAKYDSVEVLHWGLCGWSTQDEFNFYKQRGKDYNIDLLIIGWVDNDLDMGAWPLVADLDPAKQYPVISKIIPLLARRWTNAKEQAEYDVYFDTMYSKENLKRYSYLLREFNGFLEAQNIKSLVVMTPRPLPNQSKKRLDTIEPIIREAGFSCLNLYLPMQKKLAHFSALALQASPVNGHPGVLMTEEYATEVMDYLQTNHYLDKLPVRQANSR